MKRDWRPYVGNAVAIALFVWIGWDAWQHRVGKPDVEVRDGVSYFHDVRCSKDCSGHKAGFEWARKNDVRDKQRCGKSGSSFTEGCLIYIGEQEALEDTRSEDADPRQ